MPVPRFYGKCRQKGEALRVFHRVRFAAAAVCCRAELITCGRFVNAKGAHLNLRGRRFCGKLSLALRQYAQAGRRQ